MQDKEPYYRFLTIATRQSVMPAPLTPEQKIAQLEEQNRQLKAELDSERMARANSEQAYQYLGTQYESIRNAHVKLGNDYAELRNKHDRTQKSLDDKMAEIQNTLAVERREHNERVDNWLKVIEGKDKEIERQKKRIERQSSKLQRIGEEIVNENASVLEIKKHYNELVEQFQSIDTLSNEYDQSIAEAAKEIYKSVLTMEAKFKAATMNIQNLITSCPIEESAKQEYRVIFNELLSSPPRQIPAILSFLSDTELPTVPDSALLDSSTTSPGYSAS